MSCNTVQTSCLDHSCSCYIGYRDVIPRLGQVPGRGGQLLMHTDLGFDRSDIMFKKGQLKGHILGDIGHRRKWPFRDNSFFSRAYLLCCMYCYRYIFDISTAVIITMVYRIRRPIGTHLVKGQIYSDGSKQFTRNKLRLYSYGGMMYRIESG